MEVRIKYQKLKNFSAALCFLLFTFCFLFLSSAAEIKEPDFAGAFYPATAGELSQMVDSFFEAARPEPVRGRIFALISPHAGYAFSGQTAAFGYKLIKDGAYTTVIIIGSSHRSGFNGASVYSEGAFRTPLGLVEIDSVFACELLEKGREAEIFFNPVFFEGEHSLETQIPFLQRALKGFKIVPIIMGRADLSHCQKLADFLSQIIGVRDDVLVVASTDMSHGYDYEEAQKVDSLTIASLEEMDTRQLYYGLLKGKYQLCGGLPVATALILAKKLGHHKLQVLNYTNSALVTGQKEKGAWTVGYVSCAIDKEEETGMLNQTQRKRLLEIARSSIEKYLKEGKKIELSEDDPLLAKEMGAFVTLHKDGQLRGCIGSITARAPLYQAVKDMAVEAAVGDPRFAPVRLPELKDIEIEISVLSPLKRISSVDEIQLGIHGVIVKKGLNSGVFLPQVAEETGWTREEFLSNLCAHKAGLAPYAWKEPSAEIYIFSAEVFSE